jgi:hypothetical protein
LVLLFDGLGDARFGADAQDVIDYVVAILGAPTKDSDWVEAIQFTCPGSRVRFIDWGDLTLTFGDESSVTTGRDHFVSWEYGRPEGAILSPAGVMTPEGIGVGSTVAELQAAYPAAIVSAGDEVVASSAQLSEGLFAFVTSADSAGVITDLIGGQPCGE